MPQEIHSRNKKSAEPSRKDLI